MDELDRFGFPFSWSVDLRREIRRATKIMQSSPPGRREAWDRIRDEYDRHINERVARAAPRESESVAVVLPFPVDTGGMRVLVQFAQFLAADGFRVHLIEARLPHRQSSMAVVPNVSSRHVVDSPEALRNELRRLRPDCVLAGSWYDYFPAVEAGVGLVVGYSAGEPIFYETTSFDNQMLQFAYAAHRLPVALLAGSTSIQDVYRSRFDRSSRLISVPISEQMYTCHKRPVNTRFRIVLVGNEKVVVKDLPNTIRALQSIRAEGAEIVWVSPYQPSDEFAAKVDELHVNLNHRDLAEIMSSCNCLVFPSRFEGLGNPPIEAMALGLPAILCPNVGCDEYALAGSNCLQFQFGDYDAMLRMLRSIRDDPVLTARLVEAGHITAERYREPIIAANLVSAVRILLTTHKQNGLLDR